MKLAFRELTLCAVASLGACRSPAPLATTDDGIRDPRVDYVASPFGTGPFLVRASTVEYRPTHIEKHHGWVLLKWYDEKTGKYGAKVWVPISSVVAIEELKGQ